MAATLVGCGNATPKATLTTDVDSVSYAYGVNYTQGLREYLMRSLGDEDKLDTAYIEAFLRGMNEGINAGDDKKKRAYYMGLSQGMIMLNQVVPGINRQLFDDDSTRSISVKNFMSGFLGQVRNQKVRIPLQEAQGVIQMKSGKIHSDVIRERFAANREAGEKFLAENAKKEGVVTLPSGVQYKILREGHGPIPADSCTVEVNYEGRLINDTVFDSSYRRSKPAQLRLRQVIPGWCEALTQMPVGSEWEIYIPQELAYGERNQPNIDPLSALIFKVELLDIVDKNKNKK